MKYEQYFYVYVMMGSFICRIGMLYVFMGLVAPYVTPTLVAYEKDIIFSEFCIYITEE